MVVAALLLALLAGQDSTDRIQELLKQLDADAPAEREQAQGELAKLGAPALEAVLKAKAATTDPERLTRLTAIQASLRVAAIAPRGRLAWGREGVFTIAALDGREIRRVTARDLGVEEPRSVIPCLFSSDGRRLAFQVYEENSCQVQVLPCDGGAVERPTADLVQRKTESSTECYVHQPVAWSPDGRALAVSTYVGKESILSLAVDGKRRELKRLTLDEPAGHPWQVAWSRDGRVIHAIPPNGLTTPAIYAIDVQSGSVRKVFEGAEKRHVEPLAWNPAGDMLGFLYGPRFQVIDGLGPRVFHESKRDQRTFAWSPDGARVAIEDWEGRLNIVDCESRVAWDCAPGTGDRQFAFDPLWVDARRLIFPHFDGKGMKRIYQVDVEKKVATVIVEDADLICHHLRAVPGQSGFLFFKATSKGDWVTERHGKRTEVSRAVAADLFYCDVADGIVSRLTRGGLLPGRELEEDYTAQLQPVLWLAR